MTHRGQLRSSFPRLLERSRTPISVERMGGPVPDDERHDISPSARSPANPIARLIVPPSTNSSTRRRSGRSVPSSTVCRGRCRCCSLGTATPSCSTDRPGAGAASCRGRSARDVHGLRDGRPRHRRHPLRSLRQLPFGGGAGARSSWSTTRSRRWRCCPTSSFRVALPRCERPREKNSRPPWLCDYRSSTASGSPRPAPADRASSRRTGPASYR